MLAEIVKGIYGLAQAGLLAQQQLFTHLEMNEFHPVSPKSPCIFKHRTRNIVFSLVVDDKTKINGPILCCSTIIDVVTSSAAESEFAAAFMNAKEAVSIRNLLNSLGYNQSKTPMSTDYSFVCSFVNGTC